MAIFTEGMKFKDVTSAEQPSEAIEKGKILINTDTGRMYLDTVSSTTRIDLTPSDTALSTTSTNPIQNQALTNSIINTLEDVLATTVDSIPCGTQPLKLVTTVKSFSIATTDWTGTAGNYTTTKTWTGLKTTHVIESWIESASPSDTAATATEIANEALYQWAVASAANTIKFRATAIPSDTIKVRARIVGI